jgi:hypothetical protein
MAALMGGRVDLPFLVESPMPLAYQIAPPGRLSSAMRISRWVDGVSGVACAARPWATIGLVTRAHSPLYVKRELKRPAAPHSDARNNGPFRGSRQETTAAGNNCQPQRQGTKA